MTDFMPRNSYLSPVNQLLEYQLGNEELSPDEWPDYRELGITADDIPELIRMATDEDLYNLNDEYMFYLFESNLSEYAPIHAIRVLGQLRAASAIEPLISLFAKIDDAFDNEVLFGLSEELTNVISLIGLPAIPALAAYLADDSHDVLWRVQAIVSIKTIASVYPEHQAHCVAALSQQLESFEKNSPELNGHIIWGLTDLKAIDFLPLIEQAFEAGCVDDQVVGDWDDVQEKFGLKRITNQPPKSLESRGNVTIPPLSSETVHERFPLIRLLNVQLSCHY